MKDEIKEIISIYNAILENKDIIIKEAKDFNDYTYIEYCGIKTPKVRKGESVSKGDTLGSSDTDVEVFIYNSNKDKGNISSIFFPKESIGKNVKERSGKYIIPSENTKKIKSPTDVIISNDIYNTVCPNQILIKYYKENETNEKNNTYREPNRLQGEKESSVVKFLFDKEYREKLGKIFKSEPEKEKGWLNKYFDKISTTKKVQENVNRIKGLLK
jgi:hypothetical protein